MLACAARPSQHGVKTHVSCQCWCYRTGIEPLPQDSLLNLGCVALLAEQLDSPDADMRVAAAWALANLAYSASDAARTALLTQLPSAAVVTALNDQHNGVRVGSEPQPPAPHSYPACEAYRRKSRCRSNGVTTCRADIQSVQQICNSGRDHQLCQSSVSSYIRC